MKRSRHELGNKPILRTLSEHETDPVRVPEANKPWAQFQPQRARANGSNDSPRSICVFTPTTFEFNLILRLLEPREVIAHDGLKRGEGKRGANFVTVLQTQMRARQLDTILNVFQTARLQFDLALVCGFAAALIPALRIGEIVVYERCTSASNPAREIAAAPESLCAASSLIHRSGISYFGCVGLCVDYVLTSPDEKAILGRRFNAQAADMESLQILETMQALFVPTLAIRSVSDEVDQSLPELNQVIDEHGELRASGLWRLCTRSPIQMVRLARGARRAGESLRRVMAHLLASDFRPTA